MSFLSYLQGGLSNIPCRNSVPVQRGNHTGSSTPSSGDVYTPDNTNSGNNCGQVDLTYPPTGPGSPINSYNGSVYICDVIVGASNSVRLAQSRDKSGTFKDQFSDFGPICVCVH